jgi:formylglycine-generating enzyme
VRGCGQRTGPGARRPLALGLCLCLAVIGVLGGCNRLAEAPKACLADLTLPDPASPTAGMVRLTGGVFAMGA